MFLLWYDCAGHMSLVLRTCIVFHLILWGPLHVHAYLHAQVKKPVFISLHFQAVVPWCGPMSLRALVFVKPFMPDYKLSQSDVSTCSYNTYPMEPCCYSPSDKHAWLRRWKMQWHFVRFEVNHIFMKCSYSFNTSHSCLLYFQTKVITLV